MKNYNKNVSNIIITTKMKMEKLKKKWVLNTENENNLQIKYGLLQ